jgi:hypothetical protein
MAEFFRVSKMCEPRYNTRQQQAKPRPNTESFKTQSEKGTARPKIHMTQGQSGPELRRWTRHRIDARLKVIFQGEKGPASVFGRANILGQGGMGAFIPASLPLGATVSLEVSFPYSPAEVRLQAVVRNSEGFRYGLEFVDVRDDIRDIIVKNCGAAAILQ